MMEKLIEFLMMMLASICGVLIAAFLAEKYQNWKLRRRK